jgi:hypothetical protein
LSFPEDLPMKRSLPVGLLVPSLTLFALGCGRDDTGGDTPPAETGSIACSNQVDDDGDGQIDCADSEFATLVACGGNGGRDGGADGGGVPPGAPDPSKYEATQALCSNGLDDDGDGRVDCDDRHCQYSPQVMGCAPANGEVTDATCKDGVDNDGHGFTDCDDFSCSQNPWITV